MSGSRTTPPLAATDDDESAEQLQSCALAEIARAPLAVPTVAAVYRANASASALINFIFRIPLLLFSAKASAAARRTSSYESRSRTTSKPPGLLGRDGSRHSPFRPSDKKLDRPEGGKKN